MAINRPDGGGDRRPYILKGIYDHISNTHPNRGVTILSIEKSYYYALFLMFFLEGIGDRPQTGAFFYIVPL